MLLIVQRVRYSDHGPLVKNGSNEAFKVSYYKYNCVV